MYCAAFVPVTMLAWMISEKWQWVRASCRLAGKAKIDVVLVQRKGSGGGEIQYKKSKQKIAMEKSHYPPLSQQVVPRKRHSPMCLFLSH